MRGDKTEGKERLKGKEERKRDEKKERRGTVSPDVSVV